jgi:hypothetical protein
MDGVTKGLYIFGAFIGYIGGILIPPIVHIRREMILSSADFNLQSMFPFLVGSALFFGCLTPVFLDIRDDDITWPLLVGGIAILTIATSCLVALFAKDRIFMMAN